jgi:3-dehydroquinate synthase class II
MKANDWISTAFSTVALITATSTAWSVYRERCARYVIGAPAGDLRVALRRLFERAGAVSSAIQNPDDISLVALPNFVAEMKTEGTQLMALVELSDDVPLKQHTTKALAGVQLISMSTDVEEIATTSAIVEGQMRLALRRLDKLERRPRRSFRRDNKWNP